MTPLEKIKKKRAESVNRILSKGYLSTTRVYVGMATCEIAAGSGDVMQVFREAIDKGDKGRLSEPRLRAATWSRPSKSLPPARIHQVGKVTAQGTGDYHPAHSKR